MLTLAALLYLLFVIKEPLKVEEEAKEGNKEENEKVELISVASTLLQLSWIHIFPPTS